MEPKKNLSDLPLRHQASNPRGNSNMMSVFSNMFRVRFAEKSDIHIFTMKFTPSIMQDDRKKR